MLQTPHVLQAPPVVEETYSAVRLRQMKAKDENLFNLSFLYFLQEQLSSTLYIRLRCKIDREMLENLIMLYILLARVENKKLTGIDVDQLIEVVANTTKLIDWE